MQKHYSYITIDLDKKIYTKLKAVQGDSKSRCILANLIDNNVCYDLSGTSVKVYGVKEDKTIFFNDATIVDATKGQFEIELTNQALAVAGDLKIQILILGPNQEKLSTFSFFIEVAESIIDDEAIESSNEFTALIASLSKLEEWNGYFEETSGKIEEKYTERLNELGEQFNTIMYTRFKSKKIVFLGDSITVGFVDKPFANLVAENMGMTLVNLAVSGSHVTYENDEQVKSIYVQRGEIPEDADLICIAGGTNDYGHNKIIGLSNSTSFYNFYGAYKLLIEWIQQNRPNATLFCMTPLHRENDTTENSLGYVLEDYVNVIRDVCEEKGVPVLDLFSRGELNPNIPAHKSLFAKDGLHPGQEIHTILGNYIIPNFIRGL